MRFRSTHDADPGNIAGTFPRRVLIRGVAASGAAAMLVSLPEVRAEARTGPRQATSEPPVSDILWMFGTLATGEGYCAQGIRPDGSQVATLHGLPHAVCRTTDGTSIVTATAAAGTPTQVTIHDATTGAVSHQFHGSFTWPEEPDLTLSVDRRSGAYAVAGTMLVSSPTGHYADKMAPGGGTRRVPITSWAAYEGLETFAPSGSHLDSAAPSKAELGSRPRSPTPAATSS